MTAPLHPEPATAPELRVVLVEDSAMLRGMLCEMLAELDGVGVVAEAEDEAGALAALEAQRPDLAIIDLDRITENVKHLKGLAGVDLMAVVKADAYGHGLIPVARAALAGGRSSFSGG